MTFDSAFLVRRDVERADVLIGGTRWRQTVAPAARPRPARLPQPRAGNRAHRAGTSGSFTAGR
jgi:hypothetical protein